MRETCKNGLDLLIEGCGVRGNSTDYSERVADSLENIKNVKFSLN